MLRHVLGVRR